MCTKNSFESKLKEKHFPAKINNFPVLKSACVVAEYIINKIFLLPDSREATSSVKTESANFHVESLISETKATVPNDGRNIDEQHELAACWRHRVHLRGGQRLGLLINLGVR